MDRQPRNPIGFGRVAQRRETEERDEGRTVRAIDIARRLERLEFFERKNEVKLARDPGDEDAEYALQEIRAEREEVERKLGIIR